jgi:PHP family Zn ribbon phosphoesterase
MNIVDAFGGEIPVLLDIPLSEINERVRPEIAEGILRVRQGRLRIEPGYDGQYGKVKIFDEAERKEISKQTKLF